MKSLDGSVVLALERGLVKVGWGEREARVEALEIVDEHELPQDDFDELIDAVTELVIARDRSEGAAADRQRDRLASAKAASGVYATF